MFKEEGNMLYRYYIRTLYQYIYIYIYDAVSLGSLRQEEKFAPPASKPATSRTPPGWEEADR